jgi:ferredoxin-NADP reductase
MKLKLIAKKPEGPGFITFHFEPDEEIEWQPGQYLRYRIEKPDHDERGENRFFSIASAPFENRIQLTTRFTSEKGSSLKQILQGFQIGDEVEAFGPMGHFTAEEAEQELVLIAGGIGITPFRSILLDLDHQGKDIKATLLYASRTGEVVFKKELEELAKKHPQFKIYYIISNEPATETQISENIKILPGKIDAALIKSLIIDLQSSITYISGPESMVMDLERVIWDMGIPKGQTKRDYFSGYEDY